MSGRQTTLEAGEALVSRPHRRPMVLLVDDDPDIRTMYRQYLRRMGCRVVTASDGVRAFEQAEKYVPDAIVMDLQMPRVDGWEATARIKRTPRTQHIPVIAVSAVETSRDRARLAGCDGFLAKPCSPELLWWEVRAIVGTQAAI